MLLTNFRHLLEADEVAPEAAAPVSAAFGATLDLARLIVSTSHKVRDHFW